MTTERKITRKKFWDNLQNDPKTSELINSIVAKVRGEEGKKLIDESAALKAETWSALCHQVVGCEAE